MPFDPVTGPDAAQVQAQYAVLKRIQALQNTIATANTTLATRQKELATAQSGLDAARRDRDAAGRRLFIDGTGDIPLLTALGADARYRHEKDLARLVRALEGWEEQVGAARKAAIAASTDLAKVRRDLTAQQALLAALRKPVAQNAVVAVTGQAAPGYTGGRLRWPVGGRMSSPFGTRYDPYYHVWQLHAGLDLAVPAGTPIRAAAGGTVQRAGWWGGYGNYTCVLHGVVRGQRLTTCYGHQSRTLVQPGQQVAAGQVIGLVGSTGASTGPHLHFEVRLGGRPVDPRPWL